MQEEEQHPIRHEQTGTALKWKWRKNFLNSSPFVCIIFPNRISRIERKNTSCVLLNIPHFLLYTPSFDCNGFKRLDSVQIRILYSGETGVKRPPAHTTMTIFQLRQSWNSGFPWQQHKAGQKKVTLGWGGRQVTGNSFHINLFIHSVHILIKFIK